MGFASMEKLADLLRLADLKQRSIRNSFDQSFGEASSLFSLTLQFKDVEDQLQLAKDSLLKQARELDLQAQKMAETALALEKREREVEVKSREVKERLDNLQSEDSCLALLKKWIRERSLEVSVVKNQLCLTRKKVEDSNMALDIRRDQMQDEELDWEIDVKREQLCEIEKSKEEYSGNLELNETKLDLVTVKLEECCKDLYVRSVELALVEKSLEEVERAGTSGTNYDEELELMQNELSRVKSLISECDSELELKRKQLRRLQNWTEKCTGDHDLKEKELAKVQEQIEHALNDLNSKKAHLESIEVLTKEYAEELEAKEKRYDVINRSIDKCTVDLETKLTELKSVENSIREVSGKLEVKMGKLDSVRKQLKQLTETIESKEKEFGSLNKKMKTNIRGLELKRRTLDNSIREKSEELALKENMLSSVQMSMKESTEELESVKNQWNTLKLSIIECSEELESKKKSLDLVEKSLKECSDELTSKKTEVEVMQRTASVTLLELEEREKYLDSVKVTLDQRLKKLQTKEGEFEARVKELEWREKNVGLLKKSVDERCKLLEHKEKPLMTIQRCITDGRSLQLILNENLEKYDSFLNDIVSAIQKTTSPGKLVLDAIKGFYPTNLENVDTESSLDIVRRSCTTLMSKLLKISPQVKPEPEVREEAMNVAFDWKSKMRTQPKDSLEVLAFLQLLAAYKLASCFSRDELQSLFGEIQQNAEALELQQALGFAESLPVSKTTSPTQTEDQNPLQAHASENPSTANLHSSSPLYTCPLIPELDNNMDHPELMPSEVLEALEFSSDPAKFVLDVLQVSIPQHCKNGTSGLDMGAFKSIALILEQLIKVSREVSPLVKLEAAKLAVLWKSNLKPETAEETEIRAFLLFLCAYKLASYFKGEEISRLVAKIASCKSIHSIICLLSFTDKIPEIIEILIENKQHIDAARFSCVYGLVGDFPLDIILQKSVEQVHIDAQEKATEREIAVRKAIFQCITDYELESRYETEEIVRCIADLEKKRKGKDQIFNNSKRLRVDNIQ